MKRVIMVIFMLLSLTICSFGQSYSKAQHLQIQWKRYPRIVWVALEILHTVRVPSVF
jgi:hypothetical protein